MGTLRGQCGYFPGNFVELVRDEEVAEQGVSERLSKLRKRISRARGPAGKVAATAAAAKEAATLLMEEASKQTVRSDPFSGLGTLAPPPRLTSLQADDLQFTDVDGDTVTLRPLRGSSMVEMYVNGELRIPRATVTRTGNTLEFTGKVKRPVVPLVPLLNTFALEEIVTEGATPSNPVDLERAMAFLRY